MLPRGSHQLGGWLCGRCGGDPAAALDELPYSSCCVLVATLHVGLLLCRIAPMVLTGASWDLVACLMQVPWHSAVAQVQCLPACAASRGARARLPTGMPTLDS